MKANDCNEIFYIGKECKVFLETFNDLDKKLFCNSPGCMNKSNVRANITLLFMGNYVTIYSGWICNNDIEQIMEDKIGE